MNARFSLQEKDNGKKEVNEVLENLIRGGVAFLVFWKICGMTIDGEKVD